MPQKAPKTVEPVEDIVLHEDMLTLGLKILRTPQEICTTIEGYLYRAKNLPTNAIEIAIKSEVYLDRYNEKFDEMVSKGFFALDSMKFWQKWRGNIRL